MEEASPRYNFKGPLPDFYDEMATKVWLFKVVNPLAKGSESRLLGTGICIGADGYVLSAYHLFAHVFGDSGSTIYARRHEGKYTHNLEVISTMQQWDLILLKIDKSALEDNEEQFDYVDMAVSGDLGVGKDLATIGHPGLFPFSLGLGYLVSPCPPCNFNPVKDNEMNRGEVNAYYKSVLPVSGGQHEDVSFLAACDDDVSFIRVAINLGPGASGAPFLNEFGRLVGLNLGCKKGYAFAIHVGFLREFARKTVAETLLAEAQQVEAAIVDGNGWNGLSVSNLSTSHDPMLTTFDYQGHSPLTSQKIFEAFYDCMRKVIWVVRIQYKNEQTSGCGLPKFESEEIRTGFCINSKGVILTSLENVNRERIANIQVRKGTDGELIDAELVGYDEVETNQEDFVAGRLIGNLRIKKRGPDDRFHYAQMVDMKVTVGKLVLSIGHPLSLVDTFVKGMVSSCVGVWKNCKNEEMFSIQGFGDHDQVLGAPVFDINGKVFGLVSKNKNGTVALKLTVSGSQLVRMEDSKSEDASDDDDDDDDDDDEEEEDKEILESNEDRKGFTLVRKTTNINGSSSST